LDAIAVVGPYTLIGGDDGTVFGRRKGARTWHSLNPGQRRSSAAL
jgi:hypothetical protein